MSNYDPTESIRREMVAQTNEQPTPRQELESQYGAGNVWDTRELSERFEVISFLAPFCIVRDKVTGKRGTVMFQHGPPRLYFDYNSDPDKGRW